MGRHSSQPPLTPAEEKRIVYYLRNSDELTMDEIAKVFRRDLRTIIQVSRKHGIRRSKRAAV